MRTQILSRRWNIWLGWHPVAANLTSLTQRPSSRTEFMPHMVWWSGTQPVALSFYAMKRPEQTVVLIWRSIYYGHIGQLSYPRYTVDILPLYILYILGIMCKEAKDSPGALCESKDAAADGGTSIHGLWRGLQANRVHCWIILHCMVPMLYMLYISSLFSMWNICNLYVICM